MIIESAERDIRSPNTTTIADALGFLQRRLWLCLAVALPILIAAVILAFRWPPVYMSQATIVIEQPSIAEKIVPSSITSFVDEKIQVVAQRVLARESIVQIISDFELYIEEREQYSEEEKVDLFIFNTELENLTAEVTDVRGRIVETTYAFVLGFRYGDPGVAQQVASVLADRFLEEDLESRRQAAATTTSFLEQESERLADQISEMEIRIAEFKSKYGDALPDQLRSSKFCRKLDAADDIRVRKVSGNSGAENIANPLIKNKLGRNPRVDTAKYDGKRILP